MYTFFAIFVCVTVIASAVLSSALCKPRTALVLSITEASLASVGILGIIAVFVSLLSSLASSGYSEEYNSWAFDAFYLFFKISIVITAVFLAVTVSAALTDHKMAVGRCVLSVIGAIAIVLIAPLFSGMSVSDKLPVQDFILALAVFEALTLNLRGAIDDYRLYRGLINEKEQRKKRAGKASK